MYENNHTGVFTTISAVAGGLGKLLFTKPLLLDVTVDGLITVMSYAGASAVVGYVVKIILDFQFLRNLLNWFFFHINATIIKILSNLKRRGYFIKKLIFNFVFSIINEFGKTLNDNLNLLQTI